MSGRLVALCEAIATEEMAAAAEELAAIPNHDVTRDSLFRYAVKQTMKLGVYSTNIAHDISVEFTLYKVMYFFVEACCCTYPVPVRPQTKQHQRLTPSALPTSYCHDVLEYDLANKSNTDV